MSDLYTSPVDLVPQTKARSVDINTIDAAVGAAFDKLPNELAIKTGTVTYAVDTGNAANAYVVTLAAVITAYVDGLEVKMRPLRNNTGPSTLNVNGIGAIPIKRVDGVDLKPNDILTNSPLVMRYCATTNQFYANKGDAITASEANQLLALGGQPQNIAVTSFGKGTLLPMQFVRLNKDGTQLEGAFPGISTINDLVVNNAVLPPMQLVVPVQMAALGKSITLADATKLPLGGPQYIIDNSKGAFAAGIRDNTGTLLVAVAPGGQALLSLKDNATAAGAWSISGLNLEPGLITIDQTLPNTYGATTLLTPFVALDANSSLHFAALISGGFAAFVVDNAGRIIGTPVTVSATASMVPATAFRISATQVIVFYSATTTAHLAIVLTINGTAITVGAPATLTFTSTSANWDGEDSNGMPRIAQLSPTLYVAMLGGTGTTVAVAISVAGTVVTIGAPVQLEAVNYSGQLTIYPLTANTALVIVGGGKPAVITVAGTICTFGNMVLSGLGSGAASSCLLSPTKGIVVACNGAGNTAQAQVFTIAGTVITFGAVLSLDGATISDTTPTSAANRYNPRLYPLGANSALLWYLVSSSSSTSVACILTENAGTLTKGQTLFGSFSLSGPASSGYGVLAVPGAAEFIGINEHGVAGAWRKSVVPHKITGTTITYGVGQPMPDLSPVSEINTASNGIPATRVTQGDYVIGTANMSGLLVMRSSGDVIVRRGAIALPNLFRINPVIPAVAPNRVLLVAGVSGSVNTSGIGQLRILNIEVAA